MVLMDRAEQKGAKVARAAKLEEMGGMGKFTNRILHLLEPAVEPDFELRQRDLRDMPVVEDCKGQTKFGAELFQAHLGFAGLCKNVIRGLPHRRQVVHERARPVEDDIPNHTPIIGVYRRLLNTSCS